MFRHKRATVIFLIIGLVVIAPFTGAQDTKQAEREAMYYRYLEFASYVKGGSITPHWMADGSSFWYAEGAPDNTVIWKVDPKANTKTPLFDTAPLRKAVAPLLGHEPPYQGLPFREFVFIDGEKAVKFTVEEKEFILQLDSYTVTRPPAVSEEEKNRTRPQGEEVPSPDGRWLAGVKDHNLWLRSTYDGLRVQLTTDGVEDYAWGFEDYWAWASAKWASWSPDSFKVAVRRMDYRQVPKIPLVHWLQPIEQVEWHPVRSIFSTTKAGMPLPQTELVIIDILSKRQVRVDAGASPDLHLYILGWRPDGSELLFGRVDREFKKLDLLAADPATGATRVVLGESQKTFMENIVLGPALEFQEMFLPLRDGQRFIWLSERDGWRHLYLYNFNGTLIRKLTEGAFPVEFWPTPLTVGEKAGWVYFTARGDPQRPYDTHLYRVNLEGEGFTRLTEATGQHAIQFAPSREFFLDTHSSMDRPSVVELRGADGRLLQMLSKADITALKDLKWSPPEEFVVKAADGKTDLYGVLYKPYDFNTEKKYPIIESIYGCPQAIQVPRTFTDWRGIAPQALAQLGFVTFVVDARGTPGRGKAFQDVVYGNLGRFEVPDHVAVLRQLAAKRPYMDLERVGITGGSCGGYLTARALLLAPDVYRVGVAVATWDPQFANATEVWMGLPQDNKEAYEYASNLPLAGNLQGKLLLIHGTSDTAAPFSNIMKLVEAFIRAGKPYDLIVLPDQGHSFTGTSRTYSLEAIRRYFQEHLKP